VCDDATHISLMNNRMRGQGQDCSVTQSASGVADRKTERPRHKISLFIQPLTILTFSSETSPDATVTSLHCLMLFDSHLEESPQSVVVIIFLRN
jgi:hypothetical protein